MRNNSPELVRELGFWSALAIVMGTMIGTGIFLKPAEMAREAGTIWLVLAAWIVAGLLALFGALSYAELAAAIPEAGGDYAFLKRGFGPVWGFLYGWKNAVVTRPASIASITAGMLLFCSYLVPELGATLARIEVPLPFSAEPYVFNFTLLQPLGGLAILAMTGVNYFGVRLAGRVQIMLTAIKVAVLVLIIALGFWLVEDSSFSAGPVLPAKGTAETFSGFLAAVVAALWAYSGWHGICRVGSEISDPGRIFPRTMAGGLLIVAALFLLLNVVCFYALSFEEVAASPHVISDVIERIAGAGAARWLTLAMVLSALGSLNSSVLTSARVPYAMARDGLFFRRLAAVHPRYRTPAGGLGFQAVLGSVLVLTGTFEELTAYFLFNQWIFYALSIAALFRLRWTEPDLPRPYRAWGYPVVPGVFLLLATTLTLNILITRPFRSSLGLALLLLGLAFYRHWSRRAAREHAAAVSADFSPSKAS